MKMIAITLGSYGDILPFVFLGEELVKRGYEYSIATFENFRELIENKGLRFIKISGDSEEMVSILLGNSTNTSAEGMKGIEFLLEKYPQLYDDFYKACEKCDLIIYMQFGALAYHFAEKFHIPVIRSFVFPFDATRQYCSLLGTMKRNKLACYWGNVMCQTLMSWAAIKTANTWRRQLGLKKIGRFQNYRKINGKKILTLYQYDELLAPKDKKWGKHIYLTGNWVCPVLSEKNSEIIKLYQFIKEQKGTVYVGFGSMNYDKLDELYRSILKVLLKSNKGVIIPKSCNNLVISEFKDKLPQIFMINFIPFEQFISRVDAAIHHGGNGTVHACLRNGKPQFIMAFGADQFFWGGQCYYLGIGPAPINVKKKVSKKQFENKIISLISNKTYKATAEKLSTKISENGVKVAADIIEKNFPVNSY